MGDGRDIVDEAKKLDGLPPEILKQILKSVSDRDLKRLSQVSKYIATWAKEEKDDRRKKKAKAFNDAIDKFLAKIEKLDKAKEELEKEDEEAWK